MNIARALAFALLVSGPAAQSHLYTFEGDASPDQFGQSIALVPDADGDGRADVLVGAPGGGGGPGYARLFSGADGRTLWSVTGGAGASAFGRAAAGGDLDGDGRGDAVVGDPYALVGGAFLGRVHAFDGSTGVERYALPGAASGDDYGFSVAVIGDADADGFPDVAIGSPQGTWAFVTAGPGKVDVVSGPAGGLLLQIPGGATTNSFGYSVGAIGDLDVDGFADVVVGGPIFTDHLQRASIWVCSGKDGATLLQAVGELDDILFGASVAGIGDADADGVVDLAGGTPANYVKAFSGADGSSLFTHFGSPDGTFSFSVGPAGDRDADGHADVLAGAESNSSQPHPGRVQVLAGPGGSVVFTVEGLGPGDALGEDVDGGMDVDGDSVPDLAAGAWGWPGAIAGAGYALVLSGTELPLVSDVHQVSLAAGGAQDLALCAPAYPGLVWIVLGSITGTTPGLDLGGVVLPLNRDVYFHFTVHHPGSPPLSPSAGILSSAGAAQASFTVPPGTDPALAGLLLHHAALILSPAAGSAVLATNAVPLTLIP
jgi:hypothetical protein